MFDSSIKCSYGKYVKPERYRWMLFTMRNYLAGLASLVVVLGLSSVANAADTKFLAQMDGTRLEQRADGRAVWLLRSTELHFSVMIENVWTHDAGVVFVDGVFIGAMDIVGGEGLLHMNLDIFQETFGQFPRVNVGTLVDIYSVDGDLLAYGKFRAVPESKFNSKPPVSTDPRDPTPYVSPSAGGVPSKKLP